MLGLIGTVGGAAALEIRRWRNKGTVEELNTVKKRERELRQALEVREAGARVQLCAPPAAGADPLDGVLLLLLLPGDHP